MQSTRQTWNDERMDEFAQRTAENFREVRADTKDLRREMNERFAGVERRLDVMVGVMFSGFVSLLVAIVASHFLG